MRDNFRRLDQDLATVRSGDHRILPRNPVSLLTKNNTPKSCRNSKNRCYSKNDLIFKDTFFLLIETFERCFQLKIKSYSSSTIGMIDANSFSISSPYDTAIFAIWIPKTPLSSPNPLINIQELILSKGGLRYLISCLLS